MIKEGAHHFYFGDPSKVIFNKDPTEFSKLTGNSLNCALVEILNYISKGRILGPFPGPTRILNDKLIYFANIFTLDKADSTEENPRKRTIVDFSVFMNDPMILKTCSMLHNLDLI